MDTIKKIITSTKCTTLADYINLYNKLEVEIQKINKESNKKIKIAFLSSFTTKGFKEVLHVKCCELGLLPTFYIGNYNQYAQEILNSNSGLYKFEPDLIILFIDTASIIGETYLSPYRLSDEKRKRLIDKKIGEIKTLIETVKKQTFAKLVVHNFEVPIHSPMGILENKQKFGFKESIETLNSKLRDQYKNDSQVFLFDYDAFCSKIGKQNIIDYKMYYLGDIKLDFQNIPYLCNEYTAYIKPLSSLTKKCLVLDLDNTLWGGIIGEDGIEGIKLGHTPEGRPFIEFQKYILSLLNRGVILAINSKNNLDDALSVFKNHPDMILKEEHFAAIQINWDDKISNMKAIAEELNIGLDSFVFIDDDKLNREMVRDALPEVLVVDLPEDPSLYLNTLIQLNDFNTFQITEEDKKKGKIYAQQRNRNQFEKIATDITEYLKGLNMVVTVQKANKFNIPRISQLTQKTNQFNMTTRRYLEEDIKKFSQDDKHLVISIKVEDKFGDNGITGTAIVEIDDKEWRIDTFLLSCRIIGRRIEESLLAYIIQQAQKENAKTLHSEFIPTKKNAPAKEFYKKNGFSLKNTKDGIEYWEYDLTNEYTFPEFIKIINGE